MADPIPRGGHGRMIEDCNFMVVGADVDAPRVEIHHRVIATVVPDRQTTGWRIDSQRQELVAQADAQDGWAARDCLGCELPHERDLRLHARGIARSRREHDEVRLLAGDGERRRIRRKNGDLEPPSGDSTQQRPLHTEIDQDRAAALRTIGRHVRRLAGRDRRDVVHGFPAGARRGLVDGRRRWDLSAPDDAAPGSATSQIEGQGAGVDTRDDRDPAGHQQLLERPAGASRRSHQAADDECPRVHLRGLELIGFDPVVARHGVGEHHHLTGIRRVGEDLAPACCGRREDQVAFRPDGRSPECPVLDDAPLERK